MDTDARKRLRQRLWLAWRKARLDYVAAGQPFGPDRGLEVWIEYEQQTTVN